MPGGGGFLEVYGTQGRLRMGFGQQPIEMWQDGRNEGATTYPEIRPHDNSQVYFRDAILGTRKTLTPGEYGRRALALCLSVQESSRAGIFVKVPHFDGEEEI